MRRSTLYLPTVVLFVLLGCTAEDPGTPATGTPAADTSNPESPPAAEDAVEATSLLGEALLRPALDGEFRVTQERLLGQAAGELAKSPDDADARIWVGRRLGYLGHYRKAIETYTAGIAQHPDDARFYRHRGHRYITVRQLDLAIADFERAAALLEGKAPEVEPDGLPNARNQPTGTTHSSVWYHLGLAHYLKGDFEPALEAYRECMEYSGNPDMLVATSHWLYMTLRRLGHDEEAARVLEPISAEMDVIENHAYHRLLLMYRGEMSAETLLAEGAGAAVDYGVGQWYASSGETERAREVFRAILEGDAWAAFGYIASEAEIARASRESF